MTLSSADYSLHVARQKRADGGVVGPLLGSDGGRTDTLPVKVPPGSFVIPADIVSGLPSAQGNSLAGHVALNKLFSSLPLSPDEAPYGADSPKLPHGSTIPGVHREQHHQLMGVAPTGESANSESESLAKGGAAEEGDGKPVEILAASGEYVVHPLYVKRLGHGKLKLGHEILDEFVKRQRKRNIAELKKLPGTAKR